MAMNFVFSPAHAAEPTHAGTEAAGHAEAGGDFPPFDTQYWAPQIIWLAIVFGALYWMMSRVALPRVAGILEARRTKIAADLDNAQAARQKASDAAAAHEKTLADARARAQATAQETHARLAAESDVKRKALEADLNGKLAAAEARIAATRNTAMGNVEQIATDAASAIIEHVLGRPASADSVVNAVRNSNRG